MELLHCSPVTAWLAGTGAAAVASWLGRGATDALLGAGGGGGTPAASSPSPAGPAALGRLAFVPDGAAESFETGVGAAGPVGSATLGALALYADGAATFGAVAFCTGPAAAGALALIGGAGAGAGCAGGITALLGKGPARGDAGGGVASDPAEKVMSLRPRCRRELGPMQ